MFVTLEFMKCKEDKEYHALYASARFFETAADAAAHALTTLRAYARTAESIDYTRRSLDKVKIAIYHVDPLTEYEFVNPF